MLIFSTAKMTDFSDYFYDSDSTVVAAAKALTAITSQLKSNQISKGEYNKQAIAILDFDNVAANIVDREQRTHILLAFEDMAIRADNTYP